MPNKATAAVREAIALFAENNVGRLQTWLDEIAAHDPARAADLFARLLEYHIPKLSRSDTTLSAQVTVVKWPLSRSPLDE